MGAKKSAAFSLINKTAKFIDIGNFPENISKIKPSDTLFVNAWDPISLPGNGNELDESLDGHVGRVTNIAINGSGMTNRLITHVPV